MKQSFVKKIALLMCTVMLLCALPLNVSAQAGGVRNNEITYVSTASVTQSSDKAESDTFAIISEILATAKQVISALIAYFSSTDDSVDRPLSESGVAGYLYDPDEKCFYTAADPWQRTVGYNQIFDVVSPTVLIDFDTVRFKFDYDKKNWVIQVWKGQYGLLFYGAEIGVYNKPADRRVHHFDAVSDEERLQMSMDFYEYKKGIFGKNYWKKQFSRPYDYYWWCTGFIPGNRNDEFEKLRVDARITAVDYDMLSALVSAIEKEGIVCQVKGLDVRFTYH